jgi:hypothetical protein
MIELENQVVYGFRLLRKDVGVAIVLGIALTLGLLLRVQVTSRTTTFKSADVPVSITYPATWSSVESLQDVLLKVEDPQANSPFKTTLAVESRDLDPQNPPTLEQLVDRRVAQRGSLTGYHFLSGDPATVGGAKSTRLEYAYVVQTIDQPRRASLPTVVHAIEYIVIGRLNAYFITLAAPENEFADAQAQMDQIIRTVTVQ